MKKTAYKYKLLQTTRDKTGPITFLRLWWKQTTTRFKYRYYPLILTYSNNAGLYIEKKFKDWTSLKSYLAVNQLIAA